MTRILFSLFDVSRQVFFRSSLSIGIVNLKPLLPGHVLVIPRRVVPRLTDLEPNEISDLFLSVQTVGRAVERAYNAEALTISLQDGAVAGQSVPHVHIHVIPRRTTDFEGDNDKIYPLIESAEHQLEGEMKREANKMTSQEEGKSEGDKKRKGSWRVIPDDERKPRSAKVMEEEAKWLETFFPNHQVEVCREEEGERGVSERDRNVEI